MEKDLEVRYKGFMSKYYHDLVNNSLSQLCEEFEMDDIIKENLHERFIMDLAKRINNRNPKVEFFQ